MGYYLRRQWISPELSEPSVELMDTSDDDIGQEQHEAEEHEDAEYEEGSENGQQNDEESENDPASVPEIVQEYNYEPNWNAVTLEDMIAAGYFVDVPLIGPNIPIGSGDMWGAGCVPLRLSIDQSPDGRLEDECYLFNFIEMARHLLTAVGAVASEAAISDMSYALARAINVRSSMSLTECPIRGPLVVGIVADRSAGAVIGFGVGQLQPHPAVDEHGDYTGLEWHPEVYGFSIDNDVERRRIVTEFIADAVISLDEQNIR